MNTKGPVNTSEDTELWELLGRPRKVKAPQGFADNILAEIARNPSQIVYPKRFCWQKISAIAACIIGIAAFSWNLVPQDVNSGSELVYADVDDATLYAEAIADIGADWGNAIVSVVDNDAALLQQDEDALFAL